jgi:hypothetical protein
MTELWFISLSLYGKYKKCWSVHRLPLHFKHIDLFHTAWMYMTPQTWFCKRHQFLSQLILLACVFGLHPGWDLLAFPISFEPEFDHMLQSALSFHCYSVSIHCMLLLLLLLVVVVVVLVLVFSPRASLGRNQGPVRWPVWLWYATSWARS